MNGERHMWRRDKLKVCKWNNDIWVHEEGGEHQSITTWLQNYGGASDYLRALDILRGKAQGVKFDMVFRQKEEKVGLYVPREDYEAAKKYDLGKCALFRWMCKFFPEARVRAVWDEYGVTTDGRGNAVFWAIDVDGHILHDKRIAYKADGHRDRERGAWRRYTIGKGYTGKCYFGAYACRDSEKVYVCESEKSALMFRLYYNRPVIATGGKNNLGNDCSKMVLVPDMDARDAWSEKGEVWEWWKHFEGLGDHADICDGIVSRFFL